MVLRQVEQPLLLDPLAGGLEEDPGEEAEGEERPLDHHDHPAVLWSASGEIPQWRSPGA